MNMPKDPGYRPDWKRRAILHAPKDEKKKIVFHVYGGFYSLFAKAAKRRDMSLSAYARRALAAFISKDLEIPFEDLCTNFPAVVYDQYVSKYDKGMVVIQRDDGQGYGPWQIKEFVD
jgi:hypothetical protein